MRRRLASTFVAALVLAALAAGSAQGLSRAAQSASGVDLAQASVGSLARAGTGAPSTVALPIRADLVGANWRGPAESIELRVQGVDGRWSGWVELHAGGDAPDPGSGEARRAARMLGARRSASSPVWVGGAVRVRVRATTESTVPARDVQVVAINVSGTATRRERTVTSLRSSSAWILGDTAEAQPYAPGIRPRASWKAATARTTPALADSVAGVVVHHTAGTNRYSCAQVPALLRGIQRYHMQSQGWNDIGYNYLVDACGGVWEGRGGGLTKPVIGAHTSGFNTATSGIALIGTHAAVRPTAKATSALRRLVAWRLDVAHVKPTGKMVLTARTGDKFANGSRVVVRAVSGHRDLFPTSCPGALGYSTLGRLARDAWATGGAKLANVTANVAPRFPADPLDASVARVSARAIASHADMYVTLRIERISTGEVLHSAASTGLVAATNWTVPETLQVPAWDLRIAVNGARASGQRARAALRPVVPVASDPEFVVTTPPPATVAIGGDPADDTLRLQYTLGQDYRLGAWLHDPATGAQLATLLEPTYLGPTPTPTELELAIPPDVAAGSYELRVGLPADPAAGRSIRRFAVSISR